MSISEYLEKINIRFKTGISREHSYRGDLQTLLESIAKDVLVTNEPARVACGAPDYIITRKDIPVGYIEAKDLGKPLNSKDYKEQFDRYKTSLNNLIITDYLDFWLFKDGEFVTSIKIAEIQNGQVVPLPGNFATFETFIKNFCQYIGVTLKSPAKLAVMMADKAKFLAQIIERALTEDSNYQNQTLHDQMQAFKDILIHDITPKEFADIYAQTVAYGMFAARLHDPTLPTFSRQEAAELIPRTNPFLRKLFSYIAGPDIDDRIKWIVDALADVFRATDILTLLTNFGRATQTHDPIIHFYETFLSEYDPALRKARGVWYTPEPVVKFIVRAIDDILKTEFNLPKGLADTTKTKITLKVPTNDKRYTAGLRDYEQEVHKVQILDPATGTGTFLAEVVKYIYGKNFAAMQGAWSGYVEDHLIPRLNGFELLMASYSMAHLKLDMLLRDTGYVAKREQRFRIYLTNSLEEHHKDTGSLFANWLSSEANEANQIKRDTPVMVVMGNPPYSGESANKGEWIMNLMEDYKKEPGGKEKLKERNPKWINDDYVKFIRYAQHFIERNGEGVLAFINPHGFLDNPTFRGMRWNLLKTYDKIYTLDLHGNSKKKEICPDGSPDINVFDIQQGVSINIFVKTGKKKAEELGQVFHFDLFGKRELKYDFLNQNNLKTIPYITVPNVAPNYFFIKKGYDIQLIYDEGFIIADLFPVSSVGIVTSKDAVLINTDKDKLINNVGDSYEIEIEHNLIKPISYRPFDNQFVYYDTKILERPRAEKMRHFLNRNNLGLVFSRQSTHEYWSNIQITNCLIDNRYHFSYKGIPTEAPLYLYPENSTQQNILTEAKRTPNLNPEIITEIARKLNLTFTPEKETEGEVCFANSPNVRPAFRQTFAPIDLLDYIYAVLHSPAYREKYKEFLKIDFPRVPYPQDAETFWQLVQLGGQLRQLHLLESPETENYITQYPEDGNNVVEKIRFITYDYGPVALGEPYPDYLGGVYINETQYFADVPTSAWEFYIGGYQPAQKWLKDRKGRELAFDDILHYQKIIVALKRTAELMKEIDEVFVLTSASA
ncbi:type ISP restriction/modification enzyme [Adhaeribacter aquaticus]|uniref:type ISP restriction/modification enzyme n=1 Tax=Adhaeribacter aquaticus TaxID=299567 RepID=UPI000404778B|nr:type ISP restriction/modification enzyme [Adhaeribacter aquaticus]